MDPHLRLGAADPEDLAVMAACLQDALIPLSEMAYVAADQRFMAAFTRFRRECLADPAQCEGLSQCQTVLTFDAVEAVKFRGLDPTLGGVKLELLTMIAEPADEGQFHVTMLFSGDMAIQLHLREVIARLEDFGEPWPAKITPQHELATANVVADGT